MLKITLHNKYSFPFLGIITISIFLTCERTPKVDSPIIARVGSTILTLDDLKQSIPDEYSNRISRKQQINYVKQWIDTELLYQEAIRKKIDKEKAISKRFEQMKRDLLGAEVISRNTRNNKKDKISEDLILRYYKRNKGSFIRENDLVKYLEIAVKDMKTGWSVRNLLNDDNFLEIASQYSLLPVDNPNSIPYVPVHSLPPELASTLFNIRLNGTTSPIKLANKVHIFRVMDKLKAGDTCNLEEVREDIISSLTAQIYKKNLEELLASLRQKTDYEFHFELITQKQDMHEVDLKQTGKKEPEKENNQ